MASLCSSLALRQKKNSWVQHNGRIKLFHNHQQTIFYEASSLNIEYVPKAFAAREF
jgi:hypothetical protein